MIECSFATLLNEKVQYQRKKEKGSAIRFIHSNNQGILDGIEGINDACTIPGVKDVEIYVNKGDYIKAPENSSDRIGHIITVGNNADEAEQNAEAAMSLIHIKVG